MCRKCAFSFGLKFGFTDVQRCPDVLFSSLPLQSAPTPIPGLMSWTRILTFFLMMLDSALNPNHHRGFKGLNETDNCNTCIEHSNTTAWVIYIHIYILFLVLLFHLNISTVKKGSGFEIVENKCIFVHQSYPWLLFQSFFFLDFLLAKSSFSSEFPLPYLSLQLCCSGSCMHMECQKRNVLRQDF